MSTGNSSLLDKPFSAPSLRTRDRRWWIVVALFCICFFLFTPKTPSSNCIQIIKFANAVELPLNCDSRLLAKLYRSAGTYFTEFNNWKGRPVYFLYGVLAAPIMEPVAVPLWAAIGGFADSDRKLSHYRKYFSLHLAYYALNIVVVIFSIWLALNLLGLAHQSWLAIALSGAIASTELVAGTVWLAHTNIFNLCAAITCAFYVCLGYQIRITKPRSLFVWAGCAGLLVLVYPLFIVTLPAFAVGLLLDKIFNRAITRGTAPIIQTVQLWQIMIAAILFVGPVLVWTLIVKHLFATPVYLTAQYGQFVWLLEALAQGQLLPSLLTHWHTFTETLQIHFTWFEVLLPLAGALVLLGVGDRSKLRRIDPILAALLVAVIGILSFNFLQGYYAARLQVSVAALFYMAVARLATLVDRQAIGGLTLGSILAAQIVDATLNYDITAG